MSHPQTSEREPMAEDPRVRLAREQYGVDAAGLFKALDEARAADRLLAAKLLETAERIRVFVGFAEWTR